MGELVLNKVKERNKETVFSAFTTNYSSTPAFQYSIRKEKLNVTKRLMITISCSINKLN